MTRMLVLMLMFPLALSAQRELTGTWKLKESKSFKGPDYTNALPLLITIRQQPDSIVLETTSNNGQEDSVVRESLVYGEKGINERITRGGKRKIVSFRKSEENNTWIKQTEIFEKESPGKLQSVNKEQFTVGHDGATFSLLREYNGNDDSHRNEDFVIGGTYEKVTSEELAKERATGKGVKFAEALSWEQIRAKAKKENKFIFVDCYATWCRPCKMMDKYVYPLNTVGEAMNDQFIAVKVQMDTAKNDPGYIQMLYTLARKLEKEYNITSLPTYLFFSPDGKAVHKSTGQQDAKKFIELLTKIRNPEHQLYTLINKARKRELPWGDYPGLVKKLKGEFGEKELATEIAGLYNKEYLNTLSEKELLTKARLDFIGQYAAIIHSSDKIFQICLRQPRLVDSIKEYKGGGWAEYIVNRTINREEVEPLLKEAEKTDQEPDWTRFDGQLTKQYGNELATTYTLDARVDWYAKKKSWVAYLQYLRPHLARHDLKKMSNVYLNYCVWNVFKYSGDTVLMKEALGWIDIAISNTPKENLWMTMDTKACLVYKMGRREEGIAIMKKITEMFPQFNRSFQPRLESMNKGEHIWLTLD